MIYVTHDQVEAMTMADRIVVLNGGYIEQVGSPMELYNNPASEFVAGFIGSPKMNFIKGNMAEELGATTLGIRPEHFQLTGSSQGIQCKVTLVERLGHDTIIYARSEEAGMLTVSLNGQHQQRVGDELWVQPDPAHIHRFNEIGKPVAH